MTRRFVQVDVFTTEPLRGNPVAVVLDGSGLDDDQMAALANWTNLSETTFVLPPEDPSADYRVRIFTPVQELPFAGHPALGTAHAWLEAGGSPQRGDVVVQECPAGLIPLRQEGGRLAFAAPPRVHDSIEAELDEPLPAPAARRRRDGDRLEIARTTPSSNGRGQRRLLRAHPERVRRVLDVDTEVHRAISRPRRRADEEAGIGGVRARGDRHRLVVELAVRGCDIAHG